MERSDRLENMDARANHLQEIIYWKMLLFPPINYGP